LLIFRAIFPLDASKKLFSSLKAQTSRIMKENGKNQRILLYYI